MNAFVKARADELEHGYSEDPIEEGVSRTEDAVLRGVVKEAQLWLSAIFVIVRRRRGRGG